MIQLHDFSIGYGERTLLHEVEAAIPKGSLTALIGRNGTGKSTLLRAIAGLNRRYTGEILLDGRDISDMRADEMAKTLAFVTTERTRIANLKCEDVVAVGRAPYTNWIGRMQDADREIVAWSLASVGMSDYARRTMDKMSDGECQRIMIARALAQSTPVILLDEPTSFLDLPNRYELCSLLARLAHDEGKCILFSTHELDIALSLADSIGLIDDARVTIGMVLLSMHESMNTTDDAVLAEAAEKLDSLRSNIHVLEYENLHNYLVSGDISVAYTFTPFVALALDANPDLKVVWPEEGLGFGIDGCFIPVNAPHARNANIFLQYLLRPEVAATCAEWQYYCCPNEAAKAYLSEEYLNNPVFNGIYDRLDDAEYVRNLSSEDEQKFQDIWTKFKLSMQ